MGFFHWKKKIKELFTLITDKYSQQINGFYLAELKKF